MECATEGSENVSPDGNRLLNNFVNLPNLSSVRHKNFKFKFVKCNGILCLVRGTDNFFKNWIAFP